ncbi:RNA polymerase sigma factor [Paenibacillus sp. WLX1005]|uniref:RNA polymerase sigma factor n=1 Tax=Paenibacillus sp. WLX1005 TaxID=3243766 RepID=UPI003983F4BA
MAFVNSVIIDRSDIFRQKQIIQEKITFSSSHAQSYVEKNPNNELLIPIHEQAIAYDNHQQNAHNDVSNAEYSEQHMSYSVSMTDEQYGEVAVSSDGSTSIEDELNDMIRPLYRYCLSLTRSEWDAQDLMQDTLLRAWLRQKSDCRDISQYQEAYLIRIARNLWTDTIRRRTVLQHKLQLLGGTLEQTETGNVAEQQLEAELAVQQLLNVLSPLQHVAYVLRELLNYTAAETAQLLNTSEGAVKSALKRARMTLERNRQAIGNEASSSAHDTDVTADSQRNDEVQQSSKKPASSAASVHVQPHNGKLLRDYLAAFRNGQTAELIQLILSTTADPAALAPVVIGQLTRTPSGSVLGPTPSSNALDSTPSMRLQSVYTRAEHTDYRYSA